MQIEQTGFAGLMVLTPRRFADQRGFFAETWNRAVLVRLGIDVDWVQDNHSVSATAGTLRGLHAQSPPHAQDKLVRCGCGALFDVAVDIRVGSPTFGRWFGIELSADNGKQLLVPKGFLHGFVTRQPGTEILYKCSAPYAPESEIAVRFDDPAIGIDWGIDPATTVISARDAAAPRLADLPPVFAQPARCADGALVT